MLELRLRPSTYLFMLPAGGGAECTQPRRRLWPVCTLIGHHDRNSQRSRSERRDGDFLYQLFELERRHPQNALQNVSQPGDLSIKLPRPGRGVHVSTVLICT
jgi:hypothetical protein